METLDRVYPRRRGSALPRTEKHRAILHTACPKLAGVEERARRIVATAMELAERGGFEAVRLRDVAAHAGVALGTVYRRFRGKQDLLLAALESLVADHLEEMARCPAAGATPLERLTHFFELTTARLCDRPNLARAVVRAVATGDPELTQKIAAFHTLMEEMITAALRGDRQARADAPSEAERGLAFVLQQVWFASLIGWASGLHGRAVIGEQVRTAAALLLR
jgi:AcrR family transcriptional regulator